MRRFLVRATLAVLFTLPAVAFPLFNHSPHPKPHKVKRHKGHKR